MRTKKWAFTGLLFLMSAALVAQIPANKPGGGGPPSGAAGGDLSGTFPNPTVTTSHIASGGAGFTAPVSITNTATTGQTLFINTSSLFGSAVAPVLLQGNAVSGPAFGFTNTTYGTNNKTWDIFEGATSFSFRTSDDANSTNVTWLSAVRSGNAITSITSNSGSGSWAHTGNFSATGSATVTGVLAAANYGTGEANLSSCTGISDSAQLVTVTLSATCVITLANGSALQAGRELCFHFIQAATGGPFTVTAATNMHGFFTISTLASSHNMQCFNWSGVSSEWIANSPGITGII